MLASVGHEVTRLVRVAIGPIQDHSLKPGEWRHLTVEEVRNLYRSAGMG
jgi:23S rRNA pseudouridine2605 synthase